MPVLRPLLLLALVAAGVWLAWPDEPPVTAPDGAAPVALPSASVPASKPAVVVAAVATRAGDCPRAPVLSLHEQALALQRAAAALASGTGGDAVLALLLQRPAAGNTAALALWADQLHQAALRSQDAPALRWAASGCDTSACRRELLQERLRLEPDNALHWLDWLDEEPADEEAWRGLAAARHWQERPLAAAERLRRALPPGMPAEQREALLRPLLDAAWAAPPAPSTVLANACGHYGPAHPVGAACMQAATLMLTRSDSAGAWQQGAELARQMGRSDIPPAPPPPVPPPTAGCTGKQSIR